MGSLRRKPEVGARIESADDPSGHEALRLRLRAEAEECRRELEVHIGYEGDPRTLIGWCLRASRDLAERLEKGGLSAVAVCCDYLAVDDDYPGWVFGSAPLDWDDENDMDEFDGRWKHWVVHCGGYIVDITSDQFHRRDEEIPSVVVADGNDPEWADYSHGWTSLRSDAPRMG